MWIRVDAGSSDAISFCYGGPIYETNAGLGMSLTVSLTQIDPTPANALAYGKTS